MSKVRKPILERLSLGYTFAKNREALSLVYINHFIIMIFSLVVILLHTSDETLLPVTFRYHGFILLGFIELWLLKKRWITLARILILTITPFLLLVLPPLTGLLDDEFYFWFPYVPIALSLIPHFILHPVRHRIALITILVVYLLLGIFIDNYLMLVSEGKEEIIHFVMENRFYYKLIPVLIYVFVNGAIGLLFSEIYRNEVTMERQRADLVQAEKMASLGTLTSGIAHEINNPLNFISGSLQALQTLKDEYLRLESEDVPGKEKMLKQIDQVVDSSFEGVNRASDIISSLEFFAHPGIKNKQETDLEKLVYAALKRTESRMPYYVTLTKEIPGDLKVWCHEKQFGLVLTHILRNAIDALDTKQDKDRKTIGIMAREEKIDRRLFTRISISNSGPAIPEKDLKQIFDPFFSSREAGKGIGLGMSISYMIVREHGGRIEVSSNKDGMVVFDVWLPFGPEVRHGP
ncbi:MAG: GHKL domain-containing protein [Bacteroidales bacterium]|nr:GHKL domain-containing protein [Bacteroidales bacterium]